MTYAIKGPDQMTKFISLAADEEMAWIDFMSTFHKWNQNKRGADGIKRIPGHTCVPVTVSEGDDPLKKIRRFMNGWRDEEDLEHYNILLRIDAYLKGKPA